MSAIYPISEAQAKLSKLCREGNRFVIANRNRPVMMVLPMNEFEALMETLDVLSDPKAMREIQRANTGEEYANTRDVVYELFEQLLHGN